MKPKHVERLVGVTYQISGQYDLYDPILRKLWAKMAELDWRTTTKALYVLHRFSADGSPDHAAALKARLRELRRTRDQKRKEKYFNSKLLLTVAGADGTDIAPFKAFLARYAHYVLLRAQCFGGAFGEISGGGSRRSRSSAASIVSGGLRPEHLEAAKMILAAGGKCALKKGEGENVLEEREARPKKARRPRTELLNSNARALHFYYRLRHHRILCREGRQRHEEPHRRRGEGHRKGRQERRRGAVLRRQKASLAVVHFLRDGLVPQGEGDAEGESEHFRQVRLVRAGKGRRSQQGGY